MTIVAYLSLGFLALAGSLGVLRIVRHATLGDRAVAFDMLTSILTCGLLVSSGIAIDGLNLDLAVLLGLLGFVASVAIARFIESRNEAES
ncbi:MAG: monovalent cation/H+ antiporter complex subunit F [Ilumatobacteraceae bacterium]|jgi:multicomponent Na+:H+ antiporter subunit F|nr:monovalent cation/H+ antiporter complex subunit F [Actinomycetota bacterium]MDP4850966.1 monovalent cation/H+ antiporter complex subunit F [Ilumatobacteraceae bacterium]MDP4981326.1 monovalent cation/H+ antiporter complex subunit F [Ilumatobacteraceae bacterium]